MQNVCGWTRDALWRRPPGSGQSTSLAIFPETVETRGFAEVLCFEELRCYCGGCEVADSTRWCRPVGRGANRWSRRGLTQHQFSSTESTTLGHIVFQLSQGQCGAYVWLWRGRTSPYQRGCSVVPWPHPHDRVVVALRDGSSVSK